MILANKVSVDGPLEITCVSMIHKSYSAKVKLAYPRPTTAQGREQPLGCGVRITCTILIAKVDTLIKQRESDQDSSCMPLCVPLVDLSRSD